MSKCDPPKQKTKIFFAKKSFCNKQESQVNNNENTSTSQIVQVVENVSPQDPSLPFAYKNRFHKQLETKLSKELKCYILKDESKLLLLFFYFWQISV